MKCKCKKCECDVFRASSGGGYKNHQLKSLGSKIGVYGTIDLICVSCGERHEISLGSD